MPEDDLIPLGAGSSLQFDVLTLPIEITVQDLVVMLLEQFPPQAMISFKPLLATESINKDRLRIPVEIKKGELDAFASKLAIMAQIKKGIVP